MEVRSDGHVAKAVSEHSSNGSVTIRIPTAQVVYILITLLFAAGGVVLSTHDLKNSIANLDITIQRVETSVEKVADKQEADEKTLADHAVELERHKTLLEERGNDVNKFQIIR